MVSLLRWWLPPLVWMVVIFSASADTQSTQRTSRFLEPFLRWIWPEVTAGALETVRWMVRKGAHVTEYAILAGLWWRALARPSGIQPWPWSWRTAGWVMAVVVLYAATDELHQAFVPNRTGRLMDVGIDALGGALGLALARWWSLRPGGRSQVE